MSWVQGQLYRRQLCGGLRLGLRSELPDPERMQDKIAEVSGRQVSGSIQPEKWKYCYLWEYMTGALKPEDRTFPRRGLNTVTGPSRAPAI